MALITGGSSGIGAACVRRFLSAGWRVSVVALPDNDLHWLGSVSVPATGGDLVAEKTRLEAVDRTISEYGRIDLLLNNAGIGLYAQPTEVDPDLFARLLEVNVIAPLALAQLVIPIMRRQGSGTIVSISSVAARVSLPWAAAYSASKAALDAMHDSLRLELRDTPIRLLKVCPGIVDTQFRKNVLGGEAPESVRQIGYIISPDKLADAIFRAIRKRRSTLYLPAVGSAFNLIGALAPSLMDLYLTWLMRPSRTSSSYLGDTAVGPDPNED